MSNTEQMVSVPLDELQRFIDHAACLGRSPQWIKDKAALLNAIAQPAAQHPGAPLGWVHGGGQEFTACPDHAHDLRAEGVELTAVCAHAQHQGEPVAFVYGPDLAKLKGRKSGYMELIVYEKPGTLATALYTHPGAGEVTLQQIMHAYEYAESHPHKYLRGTTNWCAAVAWHLNKNRGAQSGE